MLFVSGVPSAEDSEQMYLMKKDLVNRCKGKDFSHSLNNFLAHIYQINRNALSGRIYFEIPCPKGN